MDPSESWLGLVHSEQEQLQITTTAAQMCSAVSEITAPDATAPESESSTRSHQTLNNVLAQPVRQSIIYHHRHDNMELSEKPAPPPVATPTLIGGPPDENFVSSHPEKEAKRRSAAYREKKRTRALGRAFDKLRECLPDSSAQELSKLKSLRSAIDYIKFLQSVLEYPVEQTPGCLAGANTSTSKHSSPIIHEPQSAPEPVQHPFQRPVHYYDHTTQAIQRN